MTLHNVERDLLLTALVVGTSKISWTSLSTSDTYSFQHAFNDETIFIASFISTCFLSKIFFKVHDQNRIHAILLKAVFALSQEF